MSNRGGAVFLALLLLDTYMIVVPRQRTGWQAAKMETTMDNLDITILRKSHHMLPVEECQANRSFRSRSAKPLTCYALMLLMAWFHAPVMARQQEESRKAVAIGISR